MKPENHAIRQLEKQLEGASPEVAAQMERVILSLKTVLMNADDEAASSWGRLKLADEVARLAEMMKPGRSRENG
jgi:hypothetical protein